MDEGWLVDDIRTFCSDGCLQAEFPNADLDVLKAEAGEEGCWAYWTKWES